MPSNVPLFLLLKGKSSEFVLKIFYVLFFVLRLNNILIAPFRHAQTYYVYNDMTFICYLNMLMVSQMVLCLPQNSWMQFSFHYLQKCNTKPPFLVLFSLIYQIWQFMLYSCHRQGDVFFISFLINDRCCFENSYLRKAFWKH